MKILIVITGLGVGGAERLVTALADRYAAVGHEVLLLRLGGEAELTPQDHRVSLENLRMSRSPWSLLVGLVRFRRLVLTFKPDVVNSHLAHANILARLLRLITPMPRLISSAHNTTDGGRARMLGYRLTDGLANISTNVSREAVNAFQEKGAVRPGRMVAIHNGIDTSAFSFDPAARKRVREELGLAESTSLFLAVGRLCQQKDYPNLLRAFARISGTQNAPRLAIVGDGPLRADLDAMAAALMVKDRVHFLGIRHDIPALMAACDVFVLASAWEGFGLVVAEAMACERLVVATDCGGVREVVEQNGILVPPHECEALATALGKALHLGNEERSRLGRAARSRVIKYFSLNATADRYLGVYRGKADSPA